MTESRTTNPLPAWYGLLVVLAMWLVARPYVGLRHDGLLYLGQVLSYLNPQAMSVDPFFAYGSQESFTVFTPLLLAMYRHWDVATVQVVLLLACHGALLGALWKLLDGLDTLDRVWALLAAALLSHMYGGLAVFSFAERFVTARSLAEPLTLGALVLLVGGRRLLALIPLTLAVLLHPLMALPGAVIGWLWLAIGDRRWLAAAGLVLLPVAAAIAGVQPFSSLFRSYDPAWWAAVEKFSGQVLMLRWVSLDWQVVALDCALLAFGARLLPAALARICWAVLAATALLLGVSLVSVDLLHNVLLTQLQVWRVLWLTHVLGLAVLPALFRLAMRRPQHGALLALTLALAVVAVNARWEAGWAFMLAVAGVLWLKKAGVQISLQLQRAAQATVVVALFGVSTAVFSANAHLFLQAKQTLDEPTWLLLLATMPTIAVPASAVLLHGWTLGRRLPFLLLVLCVLGYGAATWDRRSPSTRQIESSLKGEHLFAHHIPRTAQVWWPGNTAAVWVLLKRANYHSPEQGAGVLFNRDTGIELERRRKLLTAYSVQAEFCHVTSALTGKARPPADCAPTLDIAQDICAADGGPDFIVLGHRLDKGWVSSADIAGYLDQPTTYHLHDCLHLR